MEREVLDSFRAEYQKNEEDELKRNALAVEKRPPIDSIRLTKDALKWFDRQDAFYRGLFLKRIEQLSSGHRSYVTRKLLTGCQTTIWESKLDKGMRILYTEQQTRRCHQDVGEDVSPMILVYYITKHDNVPRLVKLIDEAEKRSRRQTTAEPPKDGTVSASVLVDENNEVPFPLLLPDPLGNTPLKVYMIERSEIANMAMAGWKPRLVLTAEERACVEKEGTVLLLGRSGTGKTVCIADRMEYDRQQFLAGRQLSISKEFKQLFVARSRRIGRYVQCLVDGGYASSRHPRYNTYFATFRGLLDDLEMQLGMSRQDFLPTNSVGFGKFQRVIGKLRCTNLNPLIYWSQIRSLIKGSIQAVSAGRPLTLKEYLKLGKDQCRLTATQRKETFAVYEKYQRVCRDQHCWDSCDRISCLLSRVKNSDYETHEKLSWHKVYVDEIQDYTQAEIALFFLLSRRGGLFLAGDTAQSVVEGVQFRFDDVRSIGYELFDGDRRYVPEKPLTVNRNYRSHSGILNVAAAVLERLHTAFPKSADKLAPDVGVFVGPRPGLLYPLNGVRVNELVLQMEGATVLTHDRSAVTVAEEINGEGPTKAMVVGVRESKGLEFPNIILLNFFRGLPKDHHKAWRELLSIREDAIDTLAFTERAPGVETDLKLLYTAITRCSKRLLFVETASSMAGDAFSKWATSAKNKFVVMQAVENVEHLTRTPDEWVSAGIDCAMEAEDSLDDASRAVKWLQFAISNFQKGGSSTLRNKLNLLDLAQLHLNSAKLRDELSNFHPVGSVQHQPVESTAWEDKASSILVSLIKWGLFGEAQALCETLIPLLGSYTKKRLQKELLQVILESRKSHETSY